MVLPTSRPEPPQAASPSAQERRKAPARRGNTSPRTAKQLAAARRNLKKALASPRRLRAWRENMKKGWKAPRRYRQTPARDRANRANLTKAWQAPRTPESRARSRFNDLKHGLYARSIEETLALAGEDPKEFQGLERALTRAFEPRDDAERQLVRAVVEAVWRRLRLYRAEARWEIDRMIMLMDWCAGLKLRPYTMTQFQAYRVMEALLDRSKFERYSDQLLAEVERALRDLLRKRLGREPDFRIFTPEDLKEMEEPLTDKLLAKRLAWGDPEALKVVDEIVPEAWKK